MYFFFFPPFFPLPSTSRSVVRITGVLFARRAKKTIADDSSGVADRPRPPPSFLSLSLSLSFSRNVLLDVSSIVLPGKRDQRKLIVSYYFVLLIYQRQFSEFIRFKGERELQVPR